MGRWTGHDPRLRVIMSRRLRSRGLGAAALLLKAVRAEELAGHALGPVGGEVLGIDGGVARVTGEYGRFFGHSEPPRGKKKPPTRGMDLPITQYN
jgi:hypothetical protein